MLKRREEFASHLRRLRVTCTSRKEETSRKDHWPISVCIKSWSWCSHNPWHAQGINVVEYEVLYVVPLTSGFLFLLSLVAAREAVRRHAVQRCFRACHGTCFLISIPWPRIVIGRRSFVFSA